MTHSDLLRDLRRLARGSAIYGIGNVLLRALGFLLLPLYTRYLTRADYGTIGAMSSVLAVLALLLPLGLHGSITRLWFATDIEKERREAAGTVFVSVMVVALLLTILSDFAGDRMFRVLFPSIPYSPYGALVVWTAFLNTIGVVPLVLLQVRERALAYVTASVGGALITVAITIWLVVVRNEGAIGYLKAQLLGAAVLAVPYLWLAAQSMRITFRSSVAASALAFSLPLVPHGLAAWVLDLSDRAILVRYVSLAEVGLYSMGYQFGAIIGLVGTAFASAWVPFVYRSIQESGTAAHHRLSRLVTYYVFVLAFLGLGLSLFVHAGVVLFTATPFHAAHVITPWIVGGYVLNGLYMIPVTFLFWREKTKLIPLVTLAAGSVNVILNLVLVPAYGIRAAAIATLVAYGIMFVFALVLAQLEYPFGYEFGRAGACLAIAIALFLMAMAAPPMPLSAETAFRALLWFSFPALLLALGIVRPNERRRLLSMTLSFTRKNRHDNNDYQSAD